MRHESLEKVYGSKSDEELLVLAAESASLGDNARELLADELRRRKLAAESSLASSGFHVQSTSQARPAPRPRIKLRFVGYVVLNTLIAVFGPISLQFSVSQFHPHTGPGVIWKAWITSIVFASLLGVLVAHYGAAKAVGCTWAWVVPALIFAWRAVAYILTRETGFVTHFSGYDCAVGLQDHDCHEFLAVMIPLIRSISYSLAAGTALRISARGMKINQSVV